jgi:hypothetical protein
MFEQAATSRVSVTVRLANRQVDRRLAQPFGFLVNHADGGHLVNDLSIDQDPETRAGVIVDPGTEIQSPHVAQFRLRTQLDPPRNRLRPRAKGTTVA